MKIKIDKQLILENFITNNTNSINSTNSTNSTIGNIGNTIKQYQPDIEKVIPVECNRTINGYNNPRYDNIKCQDKIQGAALMTATMIDPGYNQFTKQ